MLKIDRTSKVWGKNIIKNTDSNLPKFNHFDIFYLCFWVGLAHGKKAKVFEPQDVSHAYTITYRRIKEMLAAIVVMSTSKSSGFKNKESLTNAINHYIDTDGLTALTSSGEELMEMYVQGGYNHMKQVMRAPQEPDIFVHRAYKEIEEGFSKNKDWSFN